MNIKFNYSKEFYKANELINARKGKLNRNEYLKINLFDVVNNNSSKTNTLKKEIEVLKELLRDAVISVQVAEATYKAFIYVYMKHQKLD